MTQRATTARAFTFANWDSRWLVPYGWVAALAAYCVLIFGEFVAGRGAQWLTNIGWTIASLLAALASWRTSRRLPDRRRTAWRLFAAACAAWLIGQLVWDWQTLVDGVAAPFPSLAEYGYVSYAVLFTAGLLFFRRMQPARRLAPQRLANLGLILCSLAVVLNTLIVEPLSRTQRSSYFLGVVLVKDLSIATTFIVAIYSMWSYRWREDLQPMLLIVLSLAVHGLCELIYAHNLLLDYPASDLVNAGWIVAFGLQHWAASEQARAEAFGARLGAVYQGEGWIEALAPAFLLLFIASTTALTVGSLSPRAMWVNVVLLAVFALILAFRETWMYSRGLQLRERMDQMQAALENAGEQLRRTAEERTELERNMELAARAGGVGLWDWNLRTKEVRYSREWKRQLGYSEHELGSDSEEWRSRLHPDDAEMVFRALDRFLADPAGEFAIETRLRHRDGSYRWILSRATVLRDDAGAPARMLGSQVDITQRKQMEMALRASEARHRELADDLEKHVVERTAELSDAYRDSQSFAYAVAHDLRAPLRAIDGFSYMLRESSGERLTDTERGYVERVRRGAMHMASLIEGLLAYSRIEHYEVHLARVELRAFIDELVAESPDLADARQVRVDVDAPALNVRADREGLRVVLRNLLENAFKFTRGAPSPRIEIGARRNDGSALLWVKDNGIGFEQTYHDQIFEIFQRLHRYGEIEGTGIGLALARKAMQRMRGRIWAKSEPGEGATFYMELPLFDEGVENERSAPG
jgi:PAS domain S-box-containing protein